MTLQEFIEKTKTDAALNAKVNAAIIGEGNPSDGTS